MLSSRGLLVLIVDDDSTRATQTAHLVRMLGSVPVIAATEPVAARVLPGADVVLAEEDALGARAVRVLQAARARRNVYRVLTTRSADDQPRGVADVVLKEPFTAVALGDVLAKAHARRRAWLAEQQAGLQAGA